MDRMGSRRRVVTAIMGGGFASSLGLGALSFVLPLFGVDASLGDIWIGSAFSGYFLARLVLAPLAGMWADRFGARPVLVWASLSGVLLPLLFFLFPDPAWLLLIQFLLGISGGLIRPVSMAVIGALGHGDSMARTFGHHAALMNAAFFLGPIAGGILYFQRSFSPVMIFLCLTMAVAAALFFWLVPEGLITHVQRSMDKPVAEASNGIAGTGLFELLLAIGGRTAGVAVLLAFLPILLARNFFENPLAVGLVTSVPSLVACAGLGLFSGRFVFGNRGVQASLGMFVSAACMFFMGDSPEIWLFVALGAGVGIGRVVSVPVSMELAALSGAAQGKVFGLANGVASAGFVLGPLLAGFLAAKTVDPGYVFRVFGLVGAALCLPLAAVSLTPKIYSRKVGLGVGGMLMIALLGTGLLLQPETPEGQENLYTYGGAAMGTMFHLTLEAPSEAVADSAAEKAREVIAALQRDYDFRNRHGSIGRINLHAGGRGARVSARAYALLQHALDMGEKTNGIFDVTIGAVTVTPLYFARSEAVAEAKRELIDYRLVRMDPASRTVMLPKSGMAIDVGGIAKGAVIDGAVEVLRNNGVTAGIVEAGGDFYCFGERLWTVGIRHPRQDRLLGHIQVREKGVCGSGDYYQYVVDVHNGRPRRRHHILDIATMRSATRSVGVTVVAESAERADALATTMLIAGPDLGRSLLRKNFPHASALWVLPDLSIQVSKEFPAFER
ncbi:MFS transporter [Pseudodesulfovibrio senegalensis]|nr:MFS transporter [Pseudodesulfovibrio senegalensis]